MDKQAQFEALDSCIPVWKRPRTKTKSIEWKVSLFVKIGTLSWVSKIAHSINCEWKILTTLTHCFGKKLNKSTILSGPCSWDMEDNCSPPVRCNFKKPHLCDADGTPAEMPFLEAILCCCDCWAVVKCELDCKHKTLTSAPAYRSFEALGKHVTTKASNAVMTRCKTPEKKSRVSFQKVNLFCWLSWKDKKQLLPKTSHSFSCRVHSALRVKLCSVEIYHSDTPPFVHIWPFYPTNKTTSDFLLNYLAVISSAEGSGRSVLLSKEISTCRRRMSHSAAEFRRVSHTSRSCIRATTE